MTEGSDFQEEIAILTVYGPILFLTGHLVRGNYLLVTAMVGLYQRLTCMEKLLPSSRQENVRICEMKSDRDARRDRKISVIVRAGPFHRSEDKSSSAPAFSVFLGASLSSIKDSGVTPCGSSDLAGKRLLSSP